jgi:hypothetical protein
MPHSGLLKINSAYKSESKNPIIAVDGKIIEKIPRIIPINTAEEYSLYMPEVL